MTTDAPLLVAIDLQEVFAQPTSEWFTPRFAEILEPIDALLGAFAEVAFTRFIAPDEPAGAWADYYARWPFAHVPPGDPLYRLVERYAQHGGARLAAATFSKWEVLAPLVPPGRLLVLCGVSTDCCVLATAIAAADAGARVRVVAEACAGLDDEAHERALSILRLFSPLVEVVPLAEALTLAGVRPGS